MSQRETENTATVATEVVKTEVAAATEKPTTLAQITNDGKTSLSLQQSLLLLAAIADEFTYLHGQACVLGKLSPEAIVFDTSEQRVTKFLTAPVYRLINKGLNKDKLVQGGKSASPAPAQIKSQVQAQTAQEEPPAVKLTKEQVAAHLARSFAENYPRSPQQNRLRQELAGDTADLSNPDELADTIATSKILTRMVESDAVISAIDNNIPSPPAAIPDVKTAEATEQTPDNLANSTPDTPFTPSFEFIAPELEATDNRFDSRADVYVLGRLFRYMLFGNDDNLIRINKCPEVLRSLLIDNCDSDPGNRLATPQLVSTTAQDLIVDADQIEADWNEACIPRRIHLSSRLGGFIRRNWFSLFLLCVITGIGCYYGWQYQQNQQKIMLERLELQQLRANADNLYKDNKLVDAIDAYRIYLERLGMRNFPERYRIIEQLVACQRELGNPQMEMMYLIMYLQEAPGGASEADFVSRLNELQARAVEKYGGVINISGQRNMVIDGETDDWEGIEPLWQDTKNLPKNRENTIMNRGRITGIWAVIVNSRLIVRIDTFLPGDPEKAEIGYVLGIDTDLGVYSDEENDWDYDICLTLANAWLKDLRGRGYAGAEELVMGERTKFAIGKCVEMAVPMAVMNSPRQFSLRVKTYDMVRQRNLSMTPQKVLLRWEDPKLSENEVENYPTITGEAPSYKRVVIKTEPVAAETTTETAKDATKTSESEPKAENTAK